MNWTVLKNYLYNLGYQVVLILTPLITAPYVSRVFGADGVGVYSYTSSVVSIFTLFASMGLNNYGQREIAKARDDKDKLSVLFWELFLARLLTTLLVIAAYVAFVINSNQYQVEYWVQIFSLMAIALDVSWFFQGLEDFRLVAIRNTVIRLIIVALILILIKEKSDLLLYIFLNSVSGFLGNFLYIGGLKNRVNRISLKKLDIKRHIGGIISFFIPVVATQIYSQLDKVMLGSMLNNEFESGYYNQCRMIVNIVIIVLTSLNAVLFPAVSNMFTSENASNISAVIKKAFYIEAALCLPIVFGLFFVSDNFVSWFYGPGYEEVGALIKISCPMIVFMGFGNLFGSLYLAPANKQNQMSVIYVIAAVVNVILNYFLIPVAYSRGALIASLIAEMVSCFGQAFLLFKSKFGFRISGDIIIYAIASALMYVFLILLHHIFSITGPAATLVDFIFGAAFYAAILFMMKEKVAVPIMREALGKIGYLARR